MVKEGMYGEGGGKKRVGANKQWNFIWALQSPSLSFSLSVSVSGSCSGPLLLSQADFIARPWTWAKQANSITMCVPVSLRVSTIHGTDSQKACYKPGGLHSHQIHFFLHALFTSLLSSSLCFLILSHTLHMAFFIFPFYIQLQTTGICVVWCTVIKMPISIWPLGARDKHTHTHKQFMHKPSRCPVSCPTPLTDLLPCCVVSSCPSTSPPAPSIVRGGWTRDSIETGLATEPDRNWRGIPQTINFSLHVFFLINPL